MGGAPAAEATAGTTRLNGRALERVPALFGAAVAVVALSRAVTGHPTANAFALTPDRLGAGKVWLFATSALVVNGPALPQLVGMLVTLTLAQQRFGARFVVVLIVVAHVAATLLAYAVLAVFTGDADGSHNRELDYGISAVWLASIGALWALALTRERRGEPLAAAAVIIGVGAFAFGAFAFPLLAATEHALAFAIGCAAFALRNRAQPLVGRLDPAHPGRSHELRRADR